MALTAEQTKALQDQFKQLRSQGMDAAAATAKIKESIASQMIERPDVGPDGRSLDNNGYRNISSGTVNAAPVVPNASVPPETPRGVQGGAYEANLTAQATTPAKPADFAATAAKIQANPQFQQAYADQTVAGRTNADRVLSGLNPQQIEAEKAKDAAWNAKQAEFDRLNPVGTPVPTANQPSEPVAGGKKSEVPADRSAEILSNLQEGQKNAPNLFKDEATFKQAYGYDGKPAEEKAQLDAFWQAQNKRTADQLIDMALARQDLTPYKGTPEYLTAQRVGKAVLDYSKMTPPLLAERMGAMESDLLPGSKAYDILSKANPQLVAEAERIRDANRRSGIIGYDENGKATANRIPDAETNISDSLTNGVSESAIPSLAAALNTPEITKAREAASATKTQLNELYDTVESIEDDVRKELKGTGATESYIRALISERTKPLMKQVNSLERKYANEAGDLKALSDVATDAFKYTWQLASENRQIEAEKEMIKYKQTLDSKPDTAVVGSDLYQYDQKTGKWAIAIKGTPKASESKSLQQVKRTNPLTGVEETVGYFDPATGTSTYYGQGQAQSGDTISGGYSAGNAGASSAGGTLADRNNNPGNLRDPKTGQFRQFATAEEGFAAMEQDLNAKLTGNSPATRAKLGRNAQTLQDVISVYAPREDNNNPEAYAAAVAKDLGISVNEPVKNLIPRISELAQAMAKHEGWSGGSAQGSQSQSTIDPQSVIASITMGDTKKYAATNAQYQNILARNGQVAASEWLIKQAVNSDNDTKKKFEAAQKETGDVSSILTMLDQANYDPGIVANKILDIKSWSGIGINEGDKQAMAVRAALIANQAKKRNDLFGASLSTNEGGSANQFLALAPGETIESIKAKLKGQLTMAQIAQDNIKMRAIGVPEETIRQREKEAVTALMDSFKSKSYSDQAVSGFAKGLTAGSDNVNKPYQKGSWSTPSKKEIQAAKDAEEAKTVAGWVKHIPGIKKYLGDATPQQSMVDAGEKIKDDSDGSYDGFKDRNPEEQKAAFKEMKTGTWYKIDEDHYIIKNRGGTVTKFVPSRLTSLTGMFPAFPAFKEMDAKSALK